jgi:uncharacterized membrane protein
MISASGTIVLVYSVFAALGPLTVSFFLSSFNQFGFLLFLSIVHITIAVIVFLMMFIHKDVEGTDQTAFQVMTHRPSTVAMEVIAEEAIESQTE